MTTIRLVREPEIELRTPRLHLIPLELRTNSPRPITLVSLQSRLPNLHRLRSPAIHNDSWILKTQRLTNWKITFFRCNKSSDDAEKRTSVMPTLFGLWVFWVLSSQGFSLKGFRGGLVSNDKSRAQTRSNHQLMMEAVGIYSQEATRHDMFEMTLGHWGTNRCPVVGFQTHTTA